MRPSHFVKSAILTALLFVFAPIGIAQAAPTTPMTLIDQTLAGKIGEAMTPVHWRTYRHCHRTGRVCHLRRHRGCARAGVAATARGM